jgi:hypothetical protein
MPAFTATFDGTSTQTANLIPSSSKVRHRDRLAVPKPGLLSGFVRGWYTRKAKRAGDRRAAFWS